MDFSTLKNHSGHYITPLFEEKIEDVVWSVELTWQGTSQRVFLYILLEFQSAVDRTMPIRLQPHLRYYLVDEGRYTDADLGLRQTPLSGVFSVENAGESWESLQRAVDRVVAIIQTGPDKERIDRIITRWLKRHLHRLGAEVNLNRLESLVEDKDMLAENLGNLVKKERLEGRQEGRLEEARDMVRTQLTFKFGEVPEWVEARLAQADHEQLKGWMRDVLFANSLEEMMKR